jgi:hypothetical protein
MGIVVNFTARTVGALANRGYHVPAAKIEAVNEAIIAFRGSSDDDVPKPYIDGSTSRIDGTVDRVTGDLQARSTLSSKKGDLLERVEYLLKCRPAQRMF